MGKAVLKRSADKILLPVDAVVAPSLENIRAAHEVARDAIPAGEAMFDIGEESVEAFTKEIERAKTVIWNGPMGVFETPPFNAGTAAVAKALAGATKRGATTIVGGGDQMSHVSTGGGASLEFLEGKVLPGVAALDDA
jgi:phosphoglycerate kinase